MRAAKMLGRPGDSQWVREAVSGTFVSQDELSIVPLSIVHTYAVSNDITLTPLGENEPVGWETPPNKPC